MLSAISTDSHPEWEKNWYRKSSGQQVKPTEGLDLTASQNGHITTMSIFQRNSSYLVVRQVLNRLDCFFSYFFFFLISSIKIGIKTESSQASQTGR